MHEPLKNRTYLGKKFLGANFVAPESSQRHKKQPVLGLVEPFEVKIWVQVGSKMAKKVVFIIVGKWGHNLPPLLRFSPF